MSLSLNLISLFLSIAALVASTLLLIRQTAFMRHANEIPVAIDLHQEFRSAEFQQAYIFVLDTLATTCSSDMGISKLPTGARIQCTKVGGLFSSLGGLVVLGLVDERYAVSLMGVQASRAWAILEPYITNERQARGDTEIYAFFEDLVCRTRDKYPLTKAYGIRFRRMADGTQEQLPPTIPPPETQ